MKRLATHPVCSHIFVAAVLALGGARMALGQTGPATDVFAPMDGVMQQALSSYSVPGGALAVFRDGRLVYVRGYGYADTDTRAVVQPDSIFRWASMSKTLTATAAMRLVEEGKLDLDARVFDLLSQYTPYNGRLGDSRLSTITVRQLLQHTGGWDRTTSAALDPVMGDGALKAAQTVNASFPPSFDTVVRYMLAQRLDATPGTRFAYSNFGYELLRRVIEKASGQSYADYVRGAILASAGLEHIQAASGTLAGRLSGEVHYYDYPGAPQLNSYISAARERQPAPYALLTPELNQASGGWAGSVVDLAKFVTQLSGERSPRLLRAESFAAMLKQSDPPTWVTSDSWYGFGLFLFNGDSGLAWDHGGYIPGTNGYFYHFGNGTGYAFLFNSASKDGAYPSAYVAQALWNALPPVEQWPHQDLFPRYSPPRIAASGVVNAASHTTDTFAPGSLVVITGTDLRDDERPASIYVRSGETERAAQLLFASSTQLIAVLPSDAPTGAATLVVRRASLSDATMPLTLAGVAPGLFTLNTDALAAATLQRQRAGATTRWEQVSRIDSSGRTVARAIEFGADDEQLTLLLYATGIRNAASPQAVTVRINDTALAASFVGAQLGQAGMDRIEVVLPRTLAGAGTVNVRVEAEGATSNTVQLLFR